MIRSHRPWPLDHEAGQTDQYLPLYFVHLWMTHRASPTSTNLTLFHAVRVHHVTASMQEGESSVPDHTGLHPICIISELEQLFIVIAETVCSRLKYTCNATVYSLHGMVICSIKLLPFSVTFLMMLVRLYRARSGVQFGSISCEDGILQQKTLSKRFLNVKVSCKC